MNKTYAIHAKPIVLPDIHRQSMPAPDYVPSANVFVLEKQHGADLGRLHQQFMALQSQTYQFFLQQQRQLWQQMLELPHKHVASKNISRRPEHPGPKFSRVELELLASGNISELFGDWFKPLDQYARLIRMPQPPLLLADRVTGIDAAPGSLQTGTIWTETDVKNDAWYIHQGRMPAGIMIESGQADLLLASWLGFDLHNRGKRVYRLLGCELSYHGELPKIGDTLCYDIHIDGHAKQGEVELFFFHYDCHINGKLRLKVRHGQAGFFTDEELANSNGVLWDAEQITPDTSTAIPPPPVVCQYHAFTQEQLQQFSQGNTYACFGEGFQWSLTHTRTPSIDHKLLLLHEITHFDTGGGPWKRGYMRATQKIHADDWFFKGHFKNDPCMPGTLMLEAGLQLAAFYLTASGYTLKTDGWRFEPVTNSAYKMLCRGQVIPTSKEVVYELFITDVIAAPLPTVFLHLLATVDGLKAFHTHLGLRLVPDWPLTADHGLLKNYVETKPISEVDGFKFDYASLLACALGKPSTAFGPFYKAFDSHRKVARLPGPPYHFMTRIVNLKGAMGSFAAGAEVEAEYDVPKQAWYFQQNAVNKMPFSVLLEVALQPCGWLASYIGSALTSEEDLIFRNLDGVGELLGEVPPGAGTIRTHVTCTKVSQIPGMIIESFHVECWLMEKLIYKADTVFGFFLQAAFVNQTGLPVPDIEKDILTTPSDVFVDLAQPDSMLSMLDRVTGFWPGKGKKGHGMMRAEKTVHASAWFFKAHFFQDPVQPGSLGIEAMLQLLQFYMRQQKLGENLNNPQFQPLALNTQLIWKYRGQVLPTNKLITVIIDIIELTRNPDAVTVIAEASLYVDNKRIYEAKNIGMRMVSTEQFAFDPAIDRWINDHKPNYVLPTLPMMSIVDLLARAASQHFSNKKLVMMEDIQMLSWALVDKPVFIRPEVTVQDNATAKVTLFLEKDQKTTALAKGTVTFADDYKPAPDEPSSLQDAQAVTDPYLNLFHGPAFQIMQELKRNNQAASAILRAEAKLAPFGYLNQVLLDGATHPIPHDNLSVWSAEIANDQAAYPVLIPHVTFYSPPPQTGFVNCQARFIGFHFSKRFPKFEIILSVAGKVWLQMQLVDALFPKGRLGIVPAKDRRAFLQDKQYVPELRLSHKEDGQFYLTEKTVLESDWISGSINALYETSGDIKMATRQILIKEYLAEQLKVHPSEIVVEKDNTTAFHKSNPAQKFSVQIEIVADKYIITG